MRSLQTIRGWITGLGIGFLVAAAGAGEEEHPRMNQATVKAMLEVIRQESSFGRMKAAMALGEARVSDPQALQILAGMLKDEYPPARVSALYALGRSRAASAAESVAPLLGDADELVRVEACRTLVALGARALAGRLPLADESPLVRQAALEAAAVIGQGALEGSVAARFAAETVPGLRAAVVRTLARLQAADALAVVQRALEDADLEVQMEALLWFVAVTGEGGKTAAASLLRHLESPHAILRRAAAQASVRIGPDAEGAVIALLADADHTVRVAAALTLGAIGGEAARAALVKTQADGVREVRRAASTALLVHATRTPDLRPAVEALAVAATRSGTPSVQREGVWMLGEMASSAGFPDILRLAVADLPRFDVEDPAAIGAFAKEDLRASALVIWTVARTAHRGGGELAAKYFLGMDQALRIHAARAIGTIKFEPAVPAMCQTLVKTRSMMGEVFYVYTGRERTLGLWALTQIGGDEVLKAFLQIATRPKPMDEVGNIRLMCEYMVQQKHVAAAGPLERMAKRQEVAGTEVAAILAQTVHALTGKAIEVKLPEPGQVGGSFFLNVRE